MDAKLEEEVRQRTETVTEMRDNIKAVRGQQYLDQLSTLLTFAVIGSVAETEGNGFVMRMADSGIRYALDAFGIAEDSPMGVDLHADVQAILKLSFIPVKAEPGAEGPVH